MLAAGQPVPIPNVGQIPPFWLGDVEVDEYSADHILLLISFYNEDFGILMVDGLPARKAKLRMWMTSL
jgi:hypothetical protein